MSATAQDMPPFAVPPGDGERERSDTCRLNHVHDVHDVHAGDPLDDAIDPRSEAIAEATKTCEGAISNSATDPGALAGEDFNAAARFLRREAPDKWFAIRGKLKTAVKTAGVKLADIERASRPDSGEVADESSVADELVALVRKRADLFHATDGTCFAALSGDGPARTYRLDTKAFAQWASFAYYESTSIDGRSGRAANEAATRTATTVLTVIATHEGDERPVFLRAARHGENYYIDLGTEDWSAIEVKAGGWRIVARPPVHFWRPGTMRPLPMPIAGGDLSLLWRYANIPKKYRPLVLAWLLDAWRHDTPFAVLELIGQQGTAKSATQSKLRRCIDPNAVDLRAAPKSVEDLFVSAGANWVTSLNNLSHLSQGTQDALCSLATGGGFAARTLFTNGDETLIEAKRPVVINGIVPLVTAQDLTDRVIHVDLPELSEYRTEADIDAEFERDASAIFGGLLDLFAATLGRLPLVKLERPPRMADYARLGEAMVAAFGWEPGAFVSLYIANRRDSVARSLEASPVASAVRRLTDESRDNLVWSGTMGSLLNKLGGFRDGTEAWPRSPRGLGDALRRQRPALAQVGIEIEIGSAGRDGVPVVIRRREHREHCERGSDCKHPSALSHGDCEVEL